MITFGDLFAGIGGFSLGFERAGMVCRWQVEIDPYCTSVLEKHWPDLERRRDVRECGRHNLEPVDVICGGPPCQPFSAAGKRRGPEDDRNLWPEFARIVQDLRPRWVVFENVLGIRAIYLDTVLSDLERMGYTTATTVIPAGALGAWHRRDRIWVVANSEKRDKWSRLREGESAGKRPGRPGDILGQAGETSWERGWAFEPGVARMVHGVPNRVDRNRVIGNAVVPQVTEFIGRLIVEVDR
jgi:DNA (cytosine-5)-methyltransferase 1